MNHGPERVHIIDSHTGGEPTRLVTAGGPPLGNGSMKERLHVFREKYDWFRSAVVNEPRGNDAIVGALLCEPVGPGSAAGVIFFNNVGYLGMCGHGTIGLMVTLQYMGRVKPGRHHIETPVGTVSAELHEDGRVTMNNVPSRRIATDVTIDVPGVGRVTGDVAWGGNWFFLVHEQRYDLTLQHLESLTQITTAIKHALIHQGITGDNGAEIDHIEVFGPSPAGAHSRNFVLCPGNAYDRSPCGTGTSAKLACLYADGKLKPGDVWRQESITGSIFEGRIEVQDGFVLPSITGSAFVNAEGDLILDPRDPLCNGIRK